MLEIRLIGAVEAVLDGVTIAMPGRRIRALLAMLALSPGETVSIDSLAVGIWDDDPPERVRGSMQTYVGRLRRLLGDDVVETRAVGYALLVPRDAVDLVNLWDSVEPAGSEGDSAAERDALAAILRRWHAEPFGDVPSDWLARHESTQWAERRLQVFERWVDLSFEFGDHRSCLEPLNRQIDHFALREPLWVRLLMALDSVGRTAEALERYEAVRSRLVDELGVDPSPELRAVYGRLLERTDEQVEPAEVSSVSSPAAVPHQLPARVRGFIGRDDLVAEMDRALADAVRDGEGAVLALHGLAGSGKTSLALQWAHRMKDEFPDGQLFLDLHGYGPGEPMSTERAVGALLRGLGIPGERIPDDIDDRSAMVRSTVAGKRLLVVLDNARESEQVRPLLSGSDTVVLVTSRTQLRGLVAREAAYRVRVDPMPPEESIALLRRRSTGDPGTGDLREVAELCGHLPVALAIAAERIGRDVVGQTGVGNVVRELQDRQSRLDALTSSQDDPLTSVRAVLEWSYRSLDDESARVFRLLGLYTAPAASTGAVAALVGSDRAGVSRAVDRLTDRHLLTPKADGYFATHDLVRAYASEVALEEPEADRVRALGRLRSWFLHSAANGQASWGAFQEQRLPDVVAGVVPEQFDSSQTASRWFESHETYLRDLIATCIADGDPTGHLLAPMLFSDLNRRQGTARAGLDLFRLAESGAAGLGDLEGQAACANAVAGSAYGRRDYEGALEAISRSRDLYARFGSYAGQLRTEGNRALVLAALDRIDEAAAAHEWVIEGARANADGQLGRYLFNASDFYLQVDRVDDAARTGEEAVELLSTMGEYEDLYTIAIGNLAEVHAAAGRLLEGAEMMTLAIAGYQRLGRRGSEANALRRLAAIYRDLGRTGDARRCLSEADDVLVSLGVSDTGRVSRAELADLIERLDEVSDE